MTLSESSEEEQQVINDQGSVNLNHFNYQYAFTPVQIQEVNPFKRKPKKKKKARITVEYKFAGTLKFESNEIVKNVGKKMKEARELAKYTQEQAAPLLGYRNSSKLNKIENGTDTNAVPLRIIIRAAHLYDVTTDFLLGESGDDWERDPVVIQQRQMGSFLLEHFERLKKAELNALRILHNRQETLFKSISRLLFRAKENEEHIKKVRELNPEFDELRGGAKLLRLLAETAEDAMGLSYELQKIRAFHEVTKKENVNLDIFDQE